MNFRVAFIIPTFNRADKLRECLCSVLNTSSDSFEIIVVNDGSTDATRAMLAEEFPQVMVVEGDGQLWWSGCIRAGADRARSESRFTHFLFLNDDVLVEEGFAERLAEVAERHPGCLVGSLITFADQSERIWCAGGRLDWLGRGAFMSTTAPQAQFWRVAWLPGMGTLVPLEVYDRVGGIDARSFPQYFGDTDFSLRVARLGVPVLCHRSLRLRNQAALTGLLLPAGPINLGTAWAILTHRRSHSNFPTRVRFWLRHCPLPLVPWQLVRYYLPLLAAMVKKLLQNKP